MVNGRDRGSLSGTDRANIQKRAYPDSVDPNKTHFTRALQELLATRQAVGLDDVNGRVFPIINTGTAGATYDGGRVVKGRRLNRTVTLRQAASTSGVLALGEPRHHPARHLTRTERAKLGKCAHVIPAALLAAHQDESVVP